MPIDSLSNTVRDILLNTNKYSLTTWWNKQGFAKQTGTYLNFFGTGENNIRPSADEAFALAVSLKTGAYDESKTGVIKQLAEKRTKKIIISLAHAHLSNSGRGGWGNSWQSALWASKTGFAGWLMWDSLSEQERKEVKTMVIYEANRFNEYQPPYYRSVDGKINYPGDTKAEENAWNATILQVALSMMPNHPNKQVWQDRMAELMLSAFARPADLKSEKKYLGQPLSEWLKGSNIENDGTLINQGKLHPDYMTTVSFNINSALTFSLAKKTIPSYALFNANRIYQALVDGEFYGTKIYQLDSGAISYPNGNGWGSMRRMNFALLDIEAATLKFDSMVNKKGNYWAGLHLKVVSDMQARSKDGRTYINRSEDKYSGREQWVADLAAQAYLVKWLEKQNAF
jgi:hypothetical protein